ncbi:MAG TPA: ComF family protein [Bacteroidales bacterium]|nr:ComF family protein [Bacteroidales bacterium]
MKWFYDLWDDFLSLLFPRICYGCGNHLLRNENIICTECLVLIPRTNYHKQKGNPVEQLFWGRCHIQSAAAFSYYNKGSRIRNLIHNMKYKGIEEIGIVLGRIYGLSLGSSAFTDSIDIIVPVPLHTSKKRSRGFNQSELIAEGLSQVTGLKVKNTAVVRSVASSTQTKRSRYDRWVNVEGIFEVADPKSIEGRHILMVDDVITTGSTIESCVNAVLKVEGVKVSVAAIAYAPA